MKEEETVAEYFLRLALQPGVSSVLSAQRLWTNVAHAIETADSSDTQASKAKKALTAIVEVIKKAITDGNTNRIDPSPFPSDDENHNNERYGISRIIESILRELAAEERRKRIRSNFSKQITKIEEKVQELILRVLLVASDAQTVTGVLCIGPTCAYQVCILLLMSVSGIALIITAMAQQKTLSLYHMHVIYDTVNFTA